MKSKQKFSVSYGCEEREAWIADVLKDDPSLAVVLAAVHLEWVVKRAILGLGASPTGTIRKELEDVFSFHRKKAANYVDVWAREVGASRRQAKLGQIITQLPRVQREALTARGVVIHGNGLLRKSQAQEAVKIFLVAAEQVRLFAKNEGFDVDKRLRPRRTR